MGRETTDRSTARGGRYGRKLVTTGCQDPEEEKKQNKGTQEKRVKGKETVRRPGPQRRGRKMKGLEF